MPKFNWDNSWLTFSWRTDENGSSWQFVSFFYILDLIMNKIHSWKYIPDYNLGFSIGLDALRRYGYLKLLCALPNYFVCLVMLHCIPDLLLMTFFLVCLKKWGKMNEFGVVYEASFNDLMFQTTTGRQGSSQRGRSLSGKSSACRCSSSLPSVKSSWRWCLGSSCSSSPSRLSTGSTATLTVSSLLRQYL